MNLDDAYADGAYIEDSANFPPKWDALADLRPAYPDRTMWLAKVWDCWHVVDQGRHHFDLIDALADKNSAMAMALVGGIHK